jgi:DNA-3-methyladenine glycosylase II
MPDAYQAASAFLAALDPEWQRHIAAVGPCLHQPHPARDPYESLVRAIGGVVSRAIVSASRADSGD